MSKTLILTESQYVRLSDYINEAKRAKPKGNQVSAKNNSNDNTQNFIDLINGEILKFLKGVKHGTGINLNYKTGGFINLCCVRRDGNTFVFTRNTPTKNKDLKKWQFFIIKLVSGKGKGDLYNLNSKLFTSSDTKLQSFNLKFNGSHDGKTIGREVWVNGIYNIDNVSCAKPAKQYKPVKKVKPKPEKQPQSQSQPQPEPPADVTPTGDTETGKSNEELVHDGKIAMNMILNNPTLKKAFYSQPTLWNLFTAELSGNKATGKGILPTLDIVGSYVDKHIIERLGAKFIEGEEVEYELVDNPNMGKQLCKVVRREIQETDAALYDEKNKIKILVKNKMHLPDVYFCDIKKEVENKIERGVKIKFFSDENARGYIPIK